MKMQTLVHPSNGDKNVPTCNICDSNAKIVEYDQRIKLYQCGTCEHTFTQIDEKYKEKEIYTEEYFDKNWFKHPNFELFQYIQKVVIIFLRKHDFKLLDIGCGSGAWLSYLRKKEPKSDLYGTDGAPCSDKDFKFIQGDFLKMELKDKFEVITSLACIEHVDNPDKFVKRLKEMLLPEGVAVIMTINSGSMMYEFAKMLNKIGIRSGYNRLFSDHHIHHFTNQSLRCLLEKHGFKILTQRNHNYSLASVDFPSAGVIKTLLLRL